MASLFRHKDKYRVQWNVEGRRKSRVFDTAKEGKLFQLKLESGEIDLEKSRSPSFSEYSEIWLRDYCEVEKAETQWREDRSTIGLHLKPYFGEVKLDRLNKSDLVRLKAQLSQKKSRTGKPLSPKSINNILGIAKKMLNSAVDLGFLDSNPWSEVRPIRSQEVEFQFWTPEERDQFLRHVSLADEEFARLVCFACHTGLRLGELAGLRRRDIDFPGRMVYVRSQYNLKLKKRLEGTKGKKVGQVPLNDVALSSISHSLDFEPLESIFSLDLFRPALRNLEAHADRAGVKRIRFHDLRHTFASCLAMAGADLMVIQKLMRHKCYQMTLRYAHLHPDHLKGATDILTHTNRTQHTLNKPENPVTLAALSV